ncbi:MOSC domain-containing protein [Tianweitania sediminis]|jgi:hypothetical protein|uniref:Molybdenum cofactor sulfurase n=1 Tax=Tianweitania sediminis TaxID=1502156 RepID=A0A8J7UHI3_9HYPH|nr:molybdenum cofactor sulfurase [Tianweitania sediminis]MBP0439219.1 molybdenum cofactor sulfurase [Tianweitania sediminis]HEV7415791.1 molybdenum cofactor sulfurase [Tianweitania sediminis]
MDDLFPRTLYDFRIAPARKLQGRVSGTFAAKGRDFVTEPVEALHLGFPGIEGDYHEGLTRQSGGREPWYKRGTEIRNERQLSIVAPDELTEIARQMELPEVRAEWIGANLAIADVPHLSMLPAGTLMFFEGGVTLKVDSQNGPCMEAGRSIAHHSGTSNAVTASLLFPKVAKRLRGLVAWVEKPGVIGNGETVSLRLPEQWIY